MRLISNWRAVAARAHSMWAFYLSVLCLVAPDAIYLVAGRDTNPRTWWMLALALLVYGIWGRLKDQGIDRDKLRSPAWIAGLAVVLMGVIIWQGRPADPVPSDAPEVVVVEVDTAQMPAPEAAFLARAVPFVGGWEGLCLTAYKDVVGVWTVCYGETRGVKPGDVYTREECETIFARRLLSFRNGIHGYLTVETLAERLPLPRDVAWTSFAYNVGVAGAGNSTATRRLNAGDVAGACDALGWWNKAGGRVIRGLVNRRAEETRLCMEGVA